MREIQDEEVRTLAAISATLRIDYSDDDPEWAISPFSWIKTRRSRQIGTSGLDAAAAADQMHRLMRAWPVLPVTEQIVAEALRSHETYQLSYWDAQVWATARVNRIPFVLSEDGWGAPEIEGVRLLNPFEPGFALPSAASTST
ncbi:MAG: PIN domain-containing protein [Actinomycetota bacterium]|nr:PIN domain-containing protein [Actinomycetota bacterium]